VTAVMERAGSGFRGVRATQVQAAIPSVSSRPPLRITPPGDPLPATRYSLLATRYNPHQPPIRSFPGLETAYLFQPGDFKFISLTPQKRRNYTGGSVAFAMSCSVNHLATLAAAASSGGSLSPIV
jgi:hypothetical protein